MKVRLITLCCLVAILCLNALMGCASENSTSENQETTTDITNQSTLDEFKNIVKKNLFKDVAAFDGRLLKTEVISTDTENRQISYCIRMMDTYGKSLAKYECNVDDAYHATTLTATSDGGFLFVLGFTDYAYTQNVWASDNGVASRVIKCDSEGNLQFDVPFNGIEGSALKFCIEKNEKFYFFGETETPETKRRGIHSPTDIYMTILSMDGMVLDTQCIAGTDYDELNMVEIFENDFLLSVCSQSDDKDFEGSASNGYRVDWVIKVNDNLEITEKSKKTGRDYFDIRLGEKNGETIYKSSSLLNDIVVGTPTAFIDYGDFYLIVSENITGEYENTPPFINATWHYTETVYSAYDNNGKLIFRSSVDSSPNYDAIVEKYNSWE